jgi:serine protease Do
LQRGDVILELDGKLVADSRDLSLKIAETAPDTVVKLKVFRSGSERELSIKLGEMPGKVSEGGRGSVGPEGALQGLSVDELTPDIARQLGLPPRTAGVVVSDVQPESAAEQAGLREGDVIQEVNRTPVRNVAEFERAVRQTGKQSVLLLVNRGGNTLFVVVGS